MGRPIHPDVVRPLQRLDPMDRAVRILARGNKKPRSVLIGAAVPQAGLEPATHAFSVHCSTN